MAKAAKKRPGRPRKSPIERPEQFSIRMTPFHKILLEIFARHQGVSLSQAIEKLIQQNAHTYEIDGRPLIVAITDRLSDVTGALTKVEEKYAVPVGMEGVGKQTAVLQSKFASLFLMPESMLTVDERAIVKACLTAEQLPSDDVLEDLSAEARSMAALGLDLDMVTAWAMKILDEQTRSKE